MSFSNIEQAMTIFVEQWGTKSHYCKIFKGTVLGFVGGVPLPMLESTRLITMMSQPTYFDVGLL